MASLYKINKYIENGFDLETGEIFDEEAIANLEMSRDEKITNICLLIKNLEADAKMYKEAKQEFDQKKSTCERKIESLKKYLTLNLEGESWDKDEKKRVKIGWRKSESVEVNDISLLPAEYLKIADPTADKTALKKALKEGKKIDGATLVESNNIQIK